MYIGIITVEYLDIHEILLLLVNSDEIHRSFGKAGMTDLLCVYLLEWGHGVLSKMILIITESSWGIDYPGAWKELWIVFKIWGILYAKPHDISCRIFYVHNGARFLLSAQRSQKPVGACCCLRRLVSWSLYRVEKSRSLRLITVNPVGLPHVRWVSLYSVR